MADDNDNIIDRNEFFGALNGPEDGEEAGDDVGIDEEAHDNLGSHGGSTSNRWKHAWTSAFDRLCKMAFEHYKLIRTRPFL